MTVILTLFLGIGLPVYAVWIAWTSGRGGWWNFAFQAVAAISLMGFLTLVLRWDVLSVYLVWLFWAAIAAVLVLGFIETRQNPRDPRGAKLLWGAVAPVIGLGLLGYALTGFLHGPAVDLSPPLADGRFVVGQGGSNPMLNYHSSFAAQRFALDILAIDEFGRRAAGLEPQALADYVIYGMPVISPCDGEVVGAVDGLAESAIGATDRDNPAGNHVVIRCHGVDLTIAHMRPGTVAVAAGESVVTGQPLGEAGNSGNTSEPHLHIHAVPEGTGREGEGVPLTFCGAFLVRNAIFEGGDIRS